MPKSKRARTVHLTQVTKKTRGDKDKLFANIRAAVAEYAYCFVFSVDNMRNNHLKDVRRELSDSRLFFGKTKLMARALGTTPEDAQADGIDALARRHLSGAVGLLFTGRSPGEVLAYLASLSAVDFARAGAVAPRDFVIPPGVVYSTAGLVPAEDDVPASHTLEPELRRLGVPTRLVQGRVVLGAGHDGGRDDGGKRRRVDRPQPQQQQQPEGDEAEGEGEEGYTVCKEGQTLDARQTRLLKLFSVCMSEFRVRVVAYWSASTGAVTEVEPDAGGDDAMEPGSD